MSLLNNEFLKRKSSHDDYTFVMWPKWVCWTNEFLKRKSSHDDYTLLMWPKCVCWTMNFWKENLSPQTLMSYNALGLAYYVGCLA
jgi:hypothetical protein